MKDGRYHSDPGSALEVRQEEEEQEEKKND